MIANKHRDHNLDKITVNIKNNTPIVMFIHNYNQIDNWATLARNDNNLNMNQIKSYLNEGSVALYLSWAWVLTEIFLLNNTNLQCRYPEGEGNVFCLLFCQVTIIRVWLSHGKVINVCLWTFNMWFRENSCLIVLFRIYI